MFSIRGKRRATRGWIGVESLESRQLLTVTALSSFGLNRTTFAIDVPATNPDPANPADTANDSHIHNFSVSITNDAGVPSTVTNGVASAMIAASQINPGSNPPTARVDLTGLVIGGAGAGMILPHSVDIHLEVNGVDTTDVTNTTDVGFNATTMRDTVSFSGSVNVPVGQATDSIGLIFENVSTHQSTPLIPFFAVTTSLPPPTIATVGPIATPTNMPVSSVPVTFSEPINGATFTPADVSLTRDGSAVDLGAFNSGLTVESNPGEPSQIVIGGLAPFTSAPGNYVLTVSPTGLQDPSGNPASGGAVSTSFTIASPVVVVPARVSSLTIDGSNVGTTPPTSATVTFTAPINVGSFLSKALLAAPPSLTLSHDGTIVYLDDLVRFNEIAPTTYRITGLDRFAATPGVYVLTISGATLVGVDGLPVNGTASAAFLVTTPATNASGAVVTQILRSRSEARSVVEIAFNRPMTVDAATDVADYTLLPATRNGGGRVVHPISATYDATSRTVSLKFVGPLRVRGYYLLKVNGLTDALTGNRLEGQTPGASGGSTYSSYFGGPGSVGTFFKVQTVVPAHRITHKSKLVAGPSHHDGLARHGR